MKLVKKYTIRIMGPDEGAEINLDEIGLSHAEDVINDELPDGYYCEIEE